MDVDTEKSREVLDASENPQPEETVMEKEAVSKLETPEESTEPGKPPAVDEETEEVAGNGHDTEVVKVNKTEEVIVAEIVTLSEEKEMKTEEILPIEQSEMASMPDVVAQPEPDESSGNVLEPGVALDKEPESIQENELEVLTAEAPSLESAPEPKPDQLAESVPEVKLQEQTLPDPVLLQLPVDNPLPNQVGQESEQMAAETEMQNTMDTRAEEVAKEEVKEKVSVEPTKEGEEKSATENLVEAVLLSPEKPTEAEKLKEEMAEAETVQPTEDKKEVAPESLLECDTAKGAEATPESEGVSSEKNEEETVPAPGSLCFAFLEQEQTKDALQTSRTLIILRGLPGSGKSFLARAIANAYKDHCSVISADDHDVKPESPESSVDGYKALDEAVVACCSAGTTSSLLMVVDDTNHSQDRLARLWDIAEQHRLVAVFLEPRTEWSRDVAQLTKKTRRGLDEAQMEAMRGQLEETSLPLYFGWFLLSSVQDKVRCTSMDFLKTLDTLEAFKKHSVDFTGKTEKEVDLEQYFKAKGTLHCTTKFCDYGKVEGAKEYAKNSAVKDFYGSVFELSLSALFVTPRTVGARVSLIEEQLLVWPTDEEQLPDSLPRGSCAHVTLGCADGVEPVQTGLDLLEILALKQEGQQGELVEEMELGSLSYYGEGRWMLSLREPICVLACFSSFYGPKEPEPSNQEPMKKKKQKCTIL